MLGLAHMLEPKPHIIPLLGGVPEGRGGCAEHRPTPAVSP